MATLIEHHWIPALAVILASAGLGFLTRAVVVRRLEALFARTATDLDDLLLAATRRHLPFWIILVGISIATRLAPLSDKWTRLLDRFCMVGLVTSLSFAAAKFLVAIVERQTKQAGATVATTTLVQNVLRVSIFALAGLLVLTNLGVSITPLLTALGVGSLAVALALQPTLSNLFAGLHIALSRPIRLGDFVGLESGAQGFVMDIGWRATRIRELPNNIIVVPNSRVAEMIITNYAMPETNQSALVQVGVSYGSDLAKVERVTCEVAQETLRSVKGGDPTFDPFIRFHTFSDSSINFSVILRVQEYPDRYLVIHEFIKNLKARFDREGIVIPFPQRVLHGNPSGERPD